MRGRAFTEILMLILFRSVAEAYFNGVGDSDCCDWGVLMTQGLLSPMSAYFEGPQCFFGPGQSQGLACEAHHVEISLGDMPIAEQAPMVRSRRSVGSEC